MGKLERDPVTTYIQWVRRLNRLMVQGPPVPPMELEVISRMAAIVRTRKSTPSPHIFAIGLFALGNAYRILGYERVASALYAKTVNYSPRHVGALHNLGNYHLRRGELSQARHCFYKVLAVDPDHYDTLVSMGAVLGQTRQWTKGVKYLLKAILTLPEKPLAYQALSRHCQICGGFTFALRTFFGMLRRHPQRTELCRLFLRKFQIGYFPILGTHGVFIEREETANLTADYARACLVADLADATARVLGTPHSTKSFLAYLQILDQLYKRAVKLRFHEVRFTIHFLRGQVYAGQCVDAFSWSIGDQGQDFMQEPLAFVLSSNEVKEVFGDVNLRAAAFEERDKAFHVALQEGIAKNINRTQLSGALVRDLVHLSLDDGEIEKCLFYIEGERAMLQGEKNIMEIEQNTRLSFLRDRLGSDEALVCFYIYEIVVDILTVIVVTADQVEFHRQALDFTQKKGLTPKHFISSHKKRIDSVSHAAEDDFWSVIVKPLLGRLEKTRSVIFVPYSYLRNIPIHLIGRDKSLWSKSTTRTYRYLPRLQLLGREMVTAPIRRRCLVVAFKGLKQSFPLDIDQEVSFLSSHFDDVVVAGDLFEPGLMSEIESGQFDYIHIACHCRYDRSRREFFLVLAGGRRYPGSQHALPNITASHVFLNACATGKDVLTHAYGDELVNLASLFLRNNVLSVVATFWPVLDRTAVAMSEAYYRHLFGGADDSALALLQAQQEMQDRPEFSDRKGWGAYFVIGSG